MDSAYSGLAAVYDRLMADVDYDSWTDYIGAFIAEELPQARLPRIVDCGCGTGSMTLRFLKRGFDVIGVDASADMLAIAQEKLRIAGYGRTPLVLEDMRMLSLHRPVEAVVSACDGMNYLLTDADAAAFLSAAYRCLQPGGLLLFDISSAHKLRSILDGRCFCENTDDCVCVWENTLDADGRALQMDVQIFTRGPDGRFDRTEETHRQRVYETDELLRLTRDCGFESIRVFEAFTRNKPDADCHRIQFLARRPKGV